MNSRRSFFGKLGALIGAALLPIGKVLKAEESDIGKAEPLNANVKGVNEAYSAEKGNIRIEEVYDFGTQFEFKDGTHSPVYHIPKEPVNSFEEVKTDNRYIINYDPASSEAECFVHTDEIVRRLPENRFSVGIQGPNGIVKGICKPDPEPSDYKKFPNDTAVSDYEFIEYEMGPFGNVKIAYNPLLDK